MTTISDPQDHRTSLVKGDGSPAPKDGLDARVLKIAGVVVIGSIMAILDMTVVGVAQNTFQSLWKVTPATAAWTMTAYTLALAAVIPITGWAADRSVPSVCTSPRSCCSCSAQCCVQRLGASVR